MKKNRLVIIIVLIFSFFCTSCIPIICKFPKTLQQIDVYLVNNSSLTIRVEKKFVEANGNVNEKFSENDEISNNGGETIVACFGADISGTADSQSIIFKIYQVDSEGNETLIHKACGWPKSWKENPPENWTCCSDEYDKYGIAFVDYEQTGNYIYNFQLNENDEFKSEMYLKYLITVTEDNEINWSVTDSMYSQEYIEF